MKGPIPRPPTGGTFLSSTAKLLTVPAAAPEHARWADDQLEALAQLIAAAGKPSTPSDEHEAEATP